MWLFIQLCLFQSQCVLPIRPRLYVATVSLQVFAAWVNGGGFLSAGVVHMLALALGRFKRVETRPVTVHEDVR